MDICERHLQDRYTSVARSLIEPPAPMMPIHSLEDKAARKQSEVLKTSSREGACLERAAAYVRERLSKRLPTCDAFPSWSGRAMLPKTIDTGARQHSTDIVSKRTTNAITSLPHARVAPTLPVRPLAHAAQAEIPRQWPNEVTLPPMSLIEGSHNIASNKVVQAALTPCSLLQVQMTISRPIRPAACPRTWLNAPRSKGIFRGLNYQITERLVKMSAKIRRA